MLLIGSRAVQYHYSAFRNPKDYDFIASPQEISSFLAAHCYRAIPSQHLNKQIFQIQINQQWTTFEFEISQRSDPVGMILKSRQISNSDSSALQLSQLDRQHFYLDPLLNVGYHIASPTSLFLLKRSHITFNIHWWKHIKDYTFLRHQTRFESRPSWWEQVYQCRYNEIKSRQHKKEINFNISNQEFFSQSAPFIHRIIEHDQLHQAIALTGTPLFLKVKDDNDQAALSPIKVAALSRQQKIQLIQEEIMVLSLERVIIPAIINGHPYQAKNIYNSYAAKMVHHYLPEFLRIFAADYFFEILNLKVNFVDKISHLLTKSN